MGASPPPDPSGPPPGSPWEHEIRALQPGDHHCHVFDTPQQSLAVLVPFLVDGLQAGHRCVTTLAETSVEDVHDALEERGIAARARTDAGDLEVRDAEEVFGDTAASFDVSQQVDDHRAMVAQAREEGYDVLRMAGEMAWTSGRLDRETLVRYEAELNRLFDEAGESLIGLCQYHVSAFEPAVLRDVLRAHPLTIHGSRVAENLFYQPPDVLLASDAQAELDRMLEHLAEDPDDD